MHRALRQVPAIKVNQLKVQSSKTIHSVQDWVFGIEFSINFHVSFTLSFHLVRGQGLSFLIIQVLPLRSNFLPQGSLQRICYSWLLWRYWSQGQSSEIFLKTNHVVNKGSPQKGFGVQMLLKSELSAMVARERKWPDDPYSRKEIKRRKGWDQNDHLSSTRGVLDSRLCWY